MKDNYLFIGHGHSLFVFLYQSFQLLHPIRRDGLHELDDFVWVVVGSDAVLFGCPVHELNAQTALLEWLALHLIHEVGVPLHFLDLHTSEEWRYLFSLFVSHLIRSIRVIRVQEEKTSCSDAATPA